MDVRLYNADCLAVLPTLSGVDAVVTDPPYNLDFDYREYDDDKPEKAYREWCQDWLHLLRDACKGPIAISVGQANLSMWATVARPDWWLAWWKPAAMGRCVVGVNNWEPIALYGKPKKQVCDVIRATIKPDRALDGHPCPKPLEWARKQVEMLSEPGDLVLDPFMGSGTTGVACVQTGRSFIGIEIDSTYFAVAEKRIAEAQGVGTLFPPAQASQSDLFAHMEKSE